MSDFKTLFSRPASAVMVGLLSSTAMSPAYADCQQSGAQTLNCSADVAPIAHDRDIINVNIDNLTSDMTDAAGVSAYISLQGTASGQKDDADSDYKAQDTDTGDTHTYGKAATGYSAYNLSTKLTLDEGYSLQSNSGGVLQRSTGAEGADGKESRGGGSTHRGEFGGDGGTGGSLTFDAFGAKVGGSGALVSGKNNPTLDFLTTGGEGGDGGEGYHTSVAHHGYGGGGGQGGRGGAISADFKGNATLATKADGQHGVSLVSTGGAGGDGGEGKSGNKGIGGVGGTGGDGGAISLTASSVENSISAKNGIGVYVNSVAGRGGNGGRASGSSVEPGDGGDGGKGGDVTVELSGSVTTEGDESHGIFLQSRGGATGTVGSTGGSGLEKHKSKAGDAGQSGALSSNLSALSVETFGLGATGIMVQSVGGFGSSGDNNSASASYGADGGSGGDGNTVDLTLGGDKTNTLVTKGEQSNAISALSVGGGGGTGAFSNGDNFLNALGGSGEAGGSGDTVSASISNTTIETEGAGSIGLIAASVGGGGGAGGGATGIVSHGGSGGSGGDGGAIDATFNGAKVTTQKEGAHGVVAASVGGGGGVSHNSNALIYRHGGSGGDGGDGGKVALTSNGQGIAVETRGDNSDGLSALSVGGGGGNGSSTFELSVFAAHKLGGTGGDGGAGGDISLAGSSSDTVTTNGNNSVGLSAVSVGGGGGRSGSSTTIALVGAAPDGSDTPGLGSELGNSGGGDGNHGGDITGSFDGNISTKGAASTGVLLVTTGLGGGSVGNYASAEVGARFTDTLGASGGSGGDGGDIDVTLSTQIATEGKNSAGVDAVSVGGGGGHSSNVVNATVGADLSASTSQGASGGASGDGGDITLKSTGAIETQGHLSAGISAVSASQGGGKSGTSIQAGVGAINFDGQVKSGSGGDGGKSGDVDVTNDGAIQTAGGLSYGVLAVSVAGGGGASGTVVDGTITAANLGEDHGGDGGSGGSGGNVKITTGTGSQVTTVGDKAKGLMALSLGGSGGAGGSVFAGSLTSLNFAGVVGGNGGDGGSAGKVEVNNGGSVKTSGDDASGVVAMSIGGHGGTGGVAADGIVSIGTFDSPNININVSVGGDGGDGGKSGPVTVSNDGAIETNGLRSAGITAQSIGGSGGSGGAIYSGSLNVIPSVEYSVSLGIGGSGGNGGIADKVGVTNSSSIRTSGNLASAIYAQSVGGNGGVAASSYLGTVNFGSPQGLSSTTSVGGSGGSGALGGDVGVNSKASLTTTGKSAHGIFAQSIGGNGGDGGAGVGILGDFAASSSDYTRLKQTAFVGGSAGTGMDAGSVNVVNDGAITTSANASYGIYAQSVGGGGGEGGSAGSYALGYLKKPKDIEQHGLDLEVTLGGSGGASGDGDSVSVSNSKAISTSGQTSYAIFAQSVGGGGGSGGNGELDFEGTLADIYGWKEKLSTLKEFFEELEKAHGKEWKELLLESWSVDIGGAGGASGQGGDITIKNTDTLTTSGDSATAIYAQSVGGGGGNGGDGSQELLTSAGVGGKDSGGGDGGDIKITSTGDINTSGDGAMGIQVQSLGGGGGNAGDVESGIVKEIGGFVETIGATALAPVDGRDGGKGGDGGAVSVEMSGILTTTGQNAHGIWAHSVGGGGGAAPELEGDSGLTVEAKIGGAGAAGHSGRVSVSIPGTVSVSGEGAHAVFAQSAAGFASESGGVTVTVAGTVEAKGKNGRAILVQADQASPSLPNNSVSAITVEKGATVRKIGSEDSYAAIGFLSGSSFKNTDGSISQSNSLTNYGTIFSPATVVESDGKGALRLTNYGTMYGQLHFAGDAQTEVTVEDGGIFNLGTSNLGSASDSVFTNNGTVKPGWENDTRAFTITSGGAFVQSSTGKLQIDVDLSGSDIKNGQLVLDTGSASLDGQVVPNFIHNPDLKNGDTGTLQSVVTYSGGGNFDRDSLSAPTDTALSYKLNWDNNNSLSVDYEVDYTGSKSGAQLSQNAVGFGQFFSDAIDQLPASGVRDSQGDALSDLGRHILNASNGQELAQMYDEHILDEAIVGTQIAQSAAQSVHSLLNSCPNLDARNPKTFYRQQECFWGKAIGRNVDQDATETMPGFSGRTSGFAIGAQREIGAGWFVEAVAQYAKTSVNGDNFSMDGNQVNAGVALKKEVGRFEFSGSIAGGFFDNDHVREYSVLTDRFSASGDIDGHFASAELRASGIYDMDGTYFKPSAALLVSQISQDDFSESGSGSLNWDVSSVEHTAVYVRPMLELGRAFSWSEGYGVGFVRTGILHQVTNPEMDIRTSLTGGSLDLRDLSLAVAPDRTQFEISAGFNAVVGEGFSVELIGNSTFSDNRNALSGQIRLQWQF